MIVMNFFGSFLGTLGVGKSSYSGMPHLLVVGEYLLKVVNPLFAMCARVFGRITLNPSNYELLDKSLEFSSVIKEQKISTKNGLN